jgi:chromosome segregation ATPase
MDIEEILERDSALKALEHAEARIAELERENEELKRERDRWSESCYYAELDRAEFSKENKALEARVEAMKNENAELLSMAMDEWGMPRFKPL